MTFVESIIHRPLSLAVLGLAVALVAVASQRSVSAGETDSAVVAVERLNGRQARGRLVSLNDKRLQLRTTSIETIDRDRVFRIDLPKPESGKTPAPPFVYLTNGDRLSVTPVTSDGEDLHGVWSHLPGKPAVRIPLLYVRGIVAEAAKSKRGPQHSAADAFRPDQKGDLILLMNGDRVSGRWKSLDAKSITMNKPATKIDRSAIRAIAFDPRFLDKPIRPEDWILVQLRDGSRFTASEVELKDGPSLRIKATFGGSIAVPLSEVASLQFLGRRAMPLSELKQTTYKYTPYIAGDADLQMNRNALGGPLKLRGREYAIGLGLRTRGVVTYELKDDQQLFRATIGVDDAAEGKGSVVFRVELDGKAVYTSPILTGESKPLAIPAIKLKGAKRLTLVADFGSHGDMLDYANWVDAVLVR